jgi:glutamine synthetase
MSIKVEYIWIGGNNELRSKTRVLNKMNYYAEAQNMQVWHADSPLTELPEWNYDGSSTKQADGDNSEVIIKPCAIFKDPFRGSHDILVLCDTWLLNRTPHPTNTRHNAKRTFTNHLDLGLEPMFGMEQEFFIMDCQTGYPVGFREDDLQKQGQYYCGIGAANCYGRKFAEEALDNCMKAGVSVTGLNFEVAIGQCELQVCDIGIKAADHLMMLRYILERTGEKYNYSIDYSTKIDMEGDWNGSGCHTNFSTKPMRENDNGYELILEAIEKLRPKHDEHIACYGEGNDKRLTGIHETSSIDVFSYGVADRGASIRIPRETERLGKGYFEDRRPASTMDPYVVTSKIFDTICI